MATFSIPKVIKKDIPHSNFNLECARRTPATVGVHIPIYHQDVLPDDYFTISDISARIKTMPFITSLMGSFRVQLDWYFEPLSNLYGFMDNNETLSTNTILAETLHRSYTLKSSDFRNYGAQSGQNPAGVWDSAYQTNDETRALGLGYVPDCSLMNYLGFPAGFDASMMTSNSAAPAGAVSRPSPSQVGVKWFNLHSFYAYHDIVRTYYSNKQSKVVRYYAGIPESSISAYKSSGSYVAYSSYWRANLGNKSYVDIPQSIMDGLFLALRMKSTEDRITPLTQLGQLPDNNDEFSRFWYYYQELFIGGVPVYAYGAEGGYNNTVMRFDAFAGLACSQYRPDIFQSVLLPNTSSITASVSVSSGAFTIDTLRVASHYQQLIDLYDVSGGQFSHWIKSQWDCEISGHTDTPILLQSSHRILTVDDVYSTARTEAGYVGEQSGTINTNAGFRGIKFHSRQYGVLMAILTIVPEVDYSKGIGFQLDYTNFSDLYTPAMANLGFEPMQTSSQSVVPVNSTEIASHVSNPFTGQFTFPRTDSEVHTKYGRNVHWYRYMTDYNKVYGAFTYGRSLSGWCLQKPSSDFYLIPSDWNYMFAYQGEGAQNWFVQLFFDVQATRAIPKFVQGTIV